jgi:hypothetical protein
MYIYTYVYVYIYMNIYIFIYAELSHCAEASRLTLDSAQQEQVALRQGIPTCILLPKTK